jgi:predicted DNA-binding transcriptional regulator AlpA
MPLVPTEDLIDAVEVAHLLGLSHRNTVSQYLIKYTDMPRPVIDLGPSRPRLWLRRDIEEWLARRGPVRRGRPAKGSNTSSENFHPPSGGVEVARGGRKPRAVQTDPAASPRKAKNT